MSPAELRELLPLYALGVLTPEEEATVDDAIAHEPSLADELVSYRDATSELIELIETVAPTAEVKTRLMASIGEGRFETFSTKMSKLFDVSVDRARELLGLAERKASWEPQMVPGMLLVHFEGGPAYTAADCGFIHLADGAVFPPHKHLGEEVSFILSGTLQVIDPDGTERTLVVGDELVQEPGTSHHLVAVRGECIFATRAIDGIEIEGARARPSKPDR